MPTPPDDDFLDALMSQLSQALKGTPMNLELSRDAIEDGLRDALRDLDATPSSERPPTMRVLQGGKSPTRDPLGHRQPELGDDLELPSLESDDEHSAPLPEPRTTRRIVRTAGLHNLARRGTVLLTGPEDWQTVYRGEAAATYRLHATRGVLQVSLDGELVEQISPGRSTDLSGRVIRLRSDSDATGVYVRMDG